MKAPRPDQRGIALIIVILAISIIIPVTLQLNRTTRSSVYEASALCDGIRLHYVAKSGFNAGRAILLAHQGTVDALTEEWANLEKISSFSQNLFDQAGFRLVIEDESGKIPLHKFIVNNVVNQDVSEMLTRLLSLPEFKLNADQVAGIVHALKDWIDADGDVTGAGGAETAYYKSLSRPYAAKNAPLESLEEMLMIKGVTKRLFYGTKDTLGLAACLTLHGSGAININTAPKQVLRTLSKEITAAMVEEMDAYRRNPQNMLADPQWYRKISSMVNVQINPNILTSRSDHFRIQSTGFMKNMTETVSGIIARDQNRKTAMLLSWKVF